MIFFKSIAIPTVLAIASVFSTGIHAETAQFDGKILRIAVNAVYPPMEYHDPSSGELIGFDIDLGDALAKQLGAKIEWQESSFAQLLPSLATQRADLIISGLNDRAERRTSADFVDYLNSGAQMFVQATRAKEFPDMTSLCGKKLGMSRSTAFPASVTAWSDNNCVKLGKPAIVVVGSEDSTAARTELKQQRVDAAVQGSETVPYAIQQEPNTYQVVGTPFSTTQQGIAFSKHDTVLRNAVGSALVELMRNGTYSALINKWHLQSSTARGVTINGEEVLK